MRRANADTRTTDLWIDTVERNSRRSSQEPHNNQHVPLETLPSRHALIEYFQRHAYGAACTDDAHCRPEEYEPILMEDLLAIRAEADEHPEALHEIRKVIWAGSRRLPTEETNPSHIANLVRALKDGIEQRRDEAAATTPDDVPTLEDEMQQLTNVIADLRGLKTGDAIEESVRTIEDWFAITLRQSHMKDLPAPMRAKTKQELTAIRQVRDELYHARLFPKMTELRNKKLQEERRNASGQAKPDQAA